MKFVYVMSEQDRDLLLSLGYVLLQEDARNGVYCFDNSPMSDGDAPPCAHVASDVMVL